MAKMHELTENEQQQIMLRMRKDARIKELWATYKERPLNLLEQIMLQQIAREYANGQI